MKELSANNQDPPSLPNGELSSFLQVANDLLLHVVDYFFPPSSQLSFKWLFCAFLDNLVVFSSNSFVCNT